ncbi:MAG: pyridoxamine 5'-phosphate oxidase family protein, partial [Gaiellaceae bacterium]
MVSSLSRQRYISLTTFRKDGSAVSTPVWVVTDDGKRLLVWTGSQTWKAKR